MFNIYNRINVCNDNLKKYKLFSLAVEIYLYFFTFLYMQPRLICKATPYIFYWRAELGCKVTAESCEAPISSMPSMARLPWLYSHEISCLAAARAAPGARSPTRKQSNCLSCGITQRQVQLPLPSPASHLPPSYSVGTSLCLSPCLCQVSDQCHFWPRRATRGGR